MERKEREEEMIVKRGEKEMERKRRGEDCKERKESKGKREKGKDSRDVVAQW